MNPIPFLKLRDLHVELPLALRPSIAGRFTMYASKVDGSRRKVAEFDADWSVARKLAEFDNLITDGGLNRMGIGDFRTTCIVGTGSAAPAVTDSQLQSTTARTQTGAPNIPGTSYTAGPPPYMTSNTGFRFSVGAAAGNLTEVGMGWTTGALLTDYALWSRALIKDELGAPTSVTILSDEVLDVYYAMRIYPPTVDATYQVTIAGELYDCISRAMAINSTLNWNVPSSRVLFTSLPGGAGFGVHGGAIGTTVGTPSGVASYSYTSPSNSAYSNNSLQQDGLLSWGLDLGNIAGGIRSVSYQTSVGAYQTQFTLVTPRGDGSTTINKDNTKVLSIGFRVGWARRP
jgi:hypothetical protein